MSRGIIWLFIPSLLTPKRSFTASHRLTRCTLSPMQSHQSWRVRDYFWNHKSSSRVRAPKGGQPLFSAHVLLSSILQLSVTARDWPFGLSCCTCWVDGTVCRCYHQASWSWGSVGLPRAWPRDDFPTNYHAALLSLLIYQDLKGHCKELWHNCQTYNSM